MVVKEKGGQRVSCWFVITFCSGWAEECGDDNNV